MRSDIFRRREIDIAQWKRLVRQFNLGSYQYRVSIDAVIRPQYAYCMLEAALLARDHGIKKISAIEFGVAGGNGLVNIEAHAREIHRELGVQANPRRCPRDDEDLHQGLWPRTHRVRILRFGLLLVNFAGVSGFRCAVRTAPAARRLPFR